MKNPSKLIFITLISTIIVTYLSIAKYKTTVAVTDTVRVAVMANNITIPVTGLEGNPGKINIYPIQLTNSQNNVVCEVSEKFNIEIVATDNLPLEIKLYKDKACTTEYTNEEFYFQAGKKEETTLYLMVEWPEQYDNYQYSQEIENIYLSVIITQID